MRWDLQGTDFQVNIVESALKKCDFPWELLDVDVIPVEWKDLSVYGVLARDALKTRATQHDPHSGQEADPLIREIDGRTRVLGLAWYSGKVSLDLSLQTNPVLAEEVFLSEAAHMTDFFWMDNGLRVAVWNAAHPDHEDLPFDATVESAVDLGHGHGWFDIGGYYTWLGEWYMGAFVLAFSHDVPVTIEFDHPLTEESVTEVRNAFTRKILEDDFLRPTPSKPVPATQGCLNRTAARGLARVNQVIRRARGYR